MALGMEHSLLISTTLELYSWGRNHRGQLGLGTTTDTSEPTFVAALSKASAVAAGEDHSAAITPGGFGIQPQKLMRSVVGIYQGESGQVFVVGTQKRTVLALRLPCQPACAIGVFGPSIEVIVCVFVFCFGIFHFFFSEHTRDPTREAGRCTRGGMRSAGSWATGPA